jgi:hypothetical protein
VIMSLWIGIYPKAFMDYIDQPVNAVVRQARPTYPLPGIATTPGPVVNQQPKVTVRTVP